MLKRTLLLEPCQAEQYNVKVVAKDMGNPPRKSPEADLTITVGRNRFSPEYERLPYSTTIRENLDVGRGVYSVKANDKDAKVGILKILKTFELMDE